MNLIGGQLHVLNGVWPASTFYDTGSPISSEGVNMGKYDHVCFLLHEGSGGAGTATLTVEACTDTSGTSPTAIAFEYRLMSVNDVWAAPVAVAATGYLTIAETNKIVAIEIDAHQLTAAKPYVRLKMTVGVATAVVGGVLILASEARYPQNVPVTAIA